MPLVYIRDITSSVSLGLWKIEESVDELYIQYPFLCVYKNKLDAKYGSDSRKLEFLTVRILLNTMTSGRIKTITHTLDGRPLIQGFNCSISHTRGFAVLILSASQKVGVDIEYRSNRVSKIVNKFVRYDEHASDVESQLIHWSVKETMFKYFSPDNLSYFDMRLSPFDIFGSGSVSVDNLKRNNKLTVFYEINEYYVLTYTY